MRWSGAVVRLQKSMPPTDTRARGEPLALVFDSRKQMGGAFLVWGRLKGTLRFWGSDIRSPMNIKGGVHNRFGQRPFLVLLKTKNAVLSPENPRDK